jgi:TolB-like protein
MPPRVRFGLFQFDPATGELSREGTPIRLQPQPARVLAILLGRAGEIVSREALRSHVWGSETFVDFKRDQTGSVEFDVVADGLADAIVPRLAQLERPKLAVVGNARLLRTARSFRDVKRIGAGLNVEYVVLGQVQRDGIGLRVVAHLIRVIDERHVWANRFDRPALTLAAQGELADEIAREVGRRLQPPE